MLTDDGKHLYVSWDEYNLLTERLALKVHGSGWEFDQILCLARGGHDYWGRQVRLVERASCEIYRAVSGDDTLDCARPGDPAPSAGCGDVTYQGYCNADTLVWCEADTLHTADCAARGKTCTWQDGDIGFNCLAP